MNDMAGFQLSRLESRMKKKLDADPTLSPAYRRSIMKMLNITIREIEHEHTSIQRIPLEAP
jgi:hypothetical protein